MIRESLTLRFGAAAGAARSGTLCAALCGTLCALLSVVRPAGAVPTVPPDFVIENATPGILWNLPVAVAFLPDGRWLVAEKRGRVWVVKNGVRHPTAFWDGASDVLDQHDRGLLGMAVDPNFATNRFVYFLYTVDFDSNQVEQPDHGYGRLTRYQMSATDSNVVDPASRTILIGATWAEGPLSASASHTIGSLRFGTDGSLLVSTGDGASYGFDPDVGNLHPGAFIPGRTHPDENIGALRAQYLGSLCGKILRIDPMTGHGYPGNPFWDGNPMSVRSRVWAYGLRNPFRFAVEPGTGSTDPADAQPGILHIGDVGWQTWEELDIATEGGKNFGWPCREGPVRLNGYWPPNPQPSHCGCDSIGLTFHNPADTTGPVSTWHHQIQGFSIPTGITGITAVGGTFYKGRRYPAQYRDRLFMADYGYSWIKVLQTDSLHHLVGVLPFSGNSEFPVEVANEPVSGDLLYVAIVNSEIRRIRYTGPVENLSPTAVANGAPLFGVAPLEVAFSSTGSSDAENDSLTTTWLFGDGEGSTDPEPKHVYDEPGFYAAVLTVTDVFGGLDRDTVLVLVASGETFPATAVLDSFERADEPLGPPWTDDLTALAVSGNRLAVTSGGGGGNASAIWDEAGVYGPVQEVFVTLEEVPPGTGAIELMLKAQGTESTEGYLGLRYDVADDAIEVRTLEPGFSPVVRGVFAPAALVPGDRFGARAFGDGIVVVYRNEQMIAATSVAEWPYAQTPGRIGLRFENAAGAVLDDFGGGAPAEIPNTPPVATILAPPDSSFFAEGDTVWLAGAGADEESPVDSLAFSWEVELHHNIHTHPPTILPGDSAFFVGETHDDGSGVFLRTRFIVADSTGLADTASVDLFPEADLRPTIVSASPDTLSAGDSLTVLLTLANDGRMLAHSSRWRLLLGDSLLAEGDTIVTPLDSVTIALAIADVPALAPGAQALRLVADALGGVVETDETDNEALRMLIVRPPGDYAVPTVIILQPGGGEGWPIGSTQSVFWSASDNVGVAAIAIELSRDGGATFALLDSGLAHTGEYAYVVLGPPGDSALVRLTARDAAGNAASDTSDAMFSIVADEKTPAVFLLSPNGGETWSVGAVYAITWTAVDNVAVTEVDLDISYDDGETFTPIAASLPHTGNHDWTVLGPATAVARVRVIARDAIGNAAADQSDAPFSLEEGTVGADPVPVAFALSSPFPSPSRERVSLVLDLPRPAVVDFGIYDIRGRKVWSGGSQVRDAGRWTLHWRGLTEDGARVPPGVYLALVTAEDHTWSRRFVILH